MSNKETLLDLEQAKGGDKGAQILTSANERLPKEIVKLILSFLTPKEYFAKRRISKIFKEVGDELFKFNTPKLAVEYLNYFRGKRDLLKNRVINGIQIPVMPDGEIVDHSIFEKEQNKFVCFVVATAPEYKWEKTSTFFNLPLNVVTEIAKLWATWLDVRDNIFPLAKSQLTQGAIVDEQMPTLIAILPYELMDKFLISYSYQKDSVNKDPVLIDLFTLKQLANLTKMELGGEDKESPTSLSL